MSEESDLDAQETEFLKHIAQYMQKALEEYGSRPIFITKAVVILQALADDDYTHLYSWRSSDTFAWEALGMLEATKFDVQQSYFT